MTQPKITVKQTADFPRAVFDVKIKDTQSTNHRVLLEESYWQHLTTRQETPKDLIRRSFAFLLEREPNTAILAEFELGVINEYFPEFENTIKKT